LFLFYFNSEQAEAHRQKARAARERRAQRVAAKREALSGAEPTPAADKKSKK
jgi:large subunit ribosomal protein L19e